MASTRSPDQLSSIIRARITTSRGAFRARDNRRTTARSSSSPAGRARKTVVQQVTSAGVVYRRPLDDLVSRLCGEFGGQGDLVGF